MNGVAGSLYERTGLTSVADMAGFVIRSELSYQADRIRRLPGGDELVHYAGITWSLTRQQAAINAQGVRDWGQWAATSLAVWGGEGNGFSYWAGLTLGSYLEGSSNLVAALLVDPLSTAEGLGGAVGAHYQAGGALAVAGMFTGGLEIYESITGADFLSGEALSGDQRFDRALAGISGITGSLNGSPILKNAVRHGARAALEKFATAPKNVLIGVNPVAPRGIVWGPAHGAGPLGPKVANTFRGGSYLEHVVDEPVTLYRVYGGGAGKLGPYWSRIKPNGPLQAQLDAALVPSWGNTAEKITTIRVPKGTIIFEGFVGPQSTGVGQLLGGGSQVYIPQVDPMWIIP